VLTQRKSFFEIMDKSKASGLARRVLEQNSPRKQLVTQQFNFTDIETPFGSSDLTLQNLKRKRVVHREEQAMER
jgi:hypothetical protein